MANYWRRVWALNPNAKRYMSSTFFRWAHMGIWSLLFNLYLSSLGFDTALIGLLNTLLSVGSMLLSLPAGLVADRLGHKRTMIIGVVGMTLSCLGVVGFSRAWPIAISYALFGIFGPFYYACGPPFLMANSTLKERSMMFTVNASLMQVAMFLATTAGGYLPGVFSAILSVGVESPTAYRGAMSVAVACLGLTLVPILTFEPQQASPSAAPTGSMVRDIWRQMPPLSLLAKLLVPRLIMAFGAGLLFPFLNLFYKERFDLSDAALGWIFGLANVAAAAIMLGGGRLAERHGKIKAVLVARTLSLPMMIMIGFVPYLPIVVLVFWVRKGLVLLGEPLYTAFAMEQLDEHKRATGSSLLRMSWDLGWSTGPYISGIAQVYGGLGPMFIATTVVYGLSLLLTHRFFLGREN